MNQNPPKNQLNSLINLYNHRKDKEVLLKANLIKEVGKAINRLTHFKKRNIIC
jgi:hypothetical protein